MLRSLLFLAVMAFGPNRNQHLDSSQNAVGRSRPGRNLDQRRPMRCAVRASREVWHSQNADRTGAGRASEGRPDCWRTSIDAGERPNAGYWKNQRKGVDAAAVPANWFRSSHAGHRDQTSLVVDPPDGRIPLTEAGKALAAAAAARRGQPPGSWLDLTMYDRCITRGVAGSIFPVIYGNGTQFIQTKGHGGDLATR